MVHIDLCQLLLLLVALITSRVAISLTFSVKMLTELGQVCMHVNVVCSCAVMYVHNHLAT